jgi:hypothetical protein
MFPHFVFLVLLFSAHGQQLYELAVMVLQCLAKCPVELRVLGVHLLVYKCKTKTLLAYLKRKTRNKKINIVVVLADDGLDVTSLVAGDLEGVVSLFLGGVVFSFSLRPGEGGGVACVPVVSAFLFLFLRS